MSRGAQATRHARDLATYWALWGLVRVLGRLPARVLYAGADVAGTALWLGSSRVRQVTRDHMAHVPAFAAGGRRRERAARACARSAARYWADLARSAHLEQEQALAETERYEGLDCLFEALDRGCGAIMISAHVGMPEFLARAAGFLGLEMLVLTEPLQPPRVHALVHEVRNQPGVQFVPADLSGVRTALAHLRAGKPVAIMADRDIQGTGHPIAFFGERAPLPSGPIELHLRTGAPVLAGFAWRTGAGRNRLRFYPPLVLPRTGDRAADLEAGMLEVARALEAGIEQAPQQWFALEPVWRGLPGRRPPRAVGPARGPTDRMAP